MMEESGSINLRPSGMPISDQVFMMEEYDGPSQLLSAVRCDDEARPPTIGRVDRQRNRQSALSLHLLR